MALIFLEVFVVFTTSRLEFQQVRLPFLASSLMMSGPQFTQRQSTGSSGLVAMLESYQKLKQKPKAVPQF